MLDLIVVGAGPTGLMAAALAVRCGLSVRIFDKAAQHAHESRAFGVHAKSLELMLSIGLADEFMNRGLIASGAQIFVDGQQVAELNFDDIGRQDSPYSFLLMVPQWDIEDILRDDLSRRGITVEQQVEVTGFTQTADGVSVQARRAGSASAGNSADLPPVQARYVLGADGAHSIVRKTLGLSFAGAAYPQSFLLVDCKVDWPLDYDHLKIFLRGREFALFLPLKGEDLCRVIVVGPDKPPASAETAEAGGAEPATLAEAEAAFRGTTGLDVRMYDARWVSGYRVHHRGVDHYGRGRVFVAGDAAHIHSPAGAQGMNTGLQDAANLVWKIALAVKGHAGAALLETYHAERWPVGQKILRYTDRLFGMVSSPVGWVTAVRNFIVPLFAGTVSRSGTMRAKAFHFVSQLGIRYHDNDFLQDDNSPDAPKAWRDGLTAGHRAPNALIARNCDVFSLITGYQFHVLALSRRPLTSTQIDEARAALDRLPRNIGLPVSTHLIAHSLVGRDPRLIQAESHQVFDAYDVSSHTLQAIYLIRPDGYIAFRADRFDFDGLARYLRDRLGAPAT